MINYKYIKISELKSIITVITLFITVTLLGQPKISFTFDDGSLANRPGYTFNEWNNLLLNKLKKANIASVFFVRGNDKRTEKGRKLVQSWNDKGHKIANHTLTHPNFNNELTTLESFKNELIKNDEVINKYSNYIKLFRFPYLKEGNTRTKIDSFRLFLKNMQYRNGYVTIDASDWYIDSRLIKKLKEHPNTNINDFKDFYLKHIWERAQFYETLSYKLNDRHISHTLLLHHNLAAALFIDDLIMMFKEKGWEIVSATDAYKDPIYNKVPAFAGESLIYALAKDSGKYESILRYPAEDSSYEKKIMDLLGL